MPVSRAPMNWARLLDLARLETCAGDEDAVVTVADFQGVAGRRISIGGSGGACTMAP